MKLAREVKVGPFILGGKKTPPITNETIKEMMNNVSIYLSVKTITSLATGLIIAIILLVFKVKLALLFALFAFLLNFIPSVGSIIAVLLPVQPSAIPYHPNQ